ncbi:MAG: hypothetical protein VXZ72_03655 [Chlamydiota bacterium]|nr:hypothetical protein [Chlamydiota bacterium]
MANIELKIITEKDAFLLKLEEDLSDGETIKKICGCFCKTMDKIKKNPQLQDPETVAINLIMIARLIKHEDSDFNNNLRKNLKETLGCIKTSINAQNIFNSITSIQNRFMYKEYDYLKSLPAHTQIFPIAFLEGQLNGNNKTTKYCCDANYFILYHLLSRKSATIENACSINESDFKEFTEKGSKILELINSNTKPQANQIINVLIRRGKNLLYFMQKNHVEDDYGEYIMIEAIKMLEAGFCLNDHLPKITEAINNTLQEIKDNSTNTQYLEECVNSVYKKIHDKQSNKQSKQRKIRLKKILTVVGIGLMLTLGYGLLFFKPMALILMDIDFTLKQFLIGTGIAIGLVGASSLIGYLSHLYEKDPCLAFFLALFLNFMLFIKIVLSIS